jgi:hypothetical protein
MYPELALYARIAAQTALAAAVGIGIVALYRIIGRDQPWLSGIVAAGVLLRASAGLALFLISYLDLPVLARFHEGNGFWSLAPDARLYFDLAVDAGEFGPQALPYAAPSPAYVWTLAIWMRLVGTSPASAVLLNLGLYALICFLLARGVAGGERVERLAVITSVSALSFSPALVLLGTQSLKDVFFVAVVSLACLAWLSIVRTLDRSEPIETRRVVGGFAALAACTFVLSSVRPYYGLILFVSTAVSLAAAALYSRRRYLGWRSGAAGAGALACVYVAFMLGSGPYYSQYSLARFLPDVGRPAAAPAVHNIEVLREGFVQAGGDTSFSRPASAEGSVGPAARARRLALGLAVLSIPIAALKALSIIEFGGGRGLLVVTDVDSVYLLSTVIATVTILVMLVRRRAFCPPLAAFTGSLVLVTALALAYVVTNYGTVFRLRLMAAAPFWILPALLVAAASRRSLEARDPAGAEGARLPR